MVELFDFWVAFASAFGCVCLKKMVKIFCTPIFAHISKNKDDEILMQDGIDKSNKYMYSTIYYLIFSAWGYLLLKDLDIYPSELGGQGQCKNYVLDERGANSNILYLSKPEGITFFSLMSLGYTLEGIINHIIVIPKQERTKDFFEMNLHHISTIALFSCMILTN